jgi:metal transporter CNNM
MLVLKKNSRCMELEIFIPILYTAKIMSIVKNEHLILCTLLMAKSLALEVCYIPFVVYLNIQKNTMNFVIFCKFIFLFPLIF